MNSPWESALFSGKVMHQRFTPTQHQFDYRLYYFWLKLSELELLNQQLRGFSTQKWALARLKPSDYLDRSAAPLTSRLHAKIDELAGQTLSGELFMLGQVRTLGLYFSPVNFYFLRQAEGYFSHMLAEVSNTPWNEKHCYLVDLAEQQDTDKAMHVSPFNPMDMRYRWQISQPSERFSMQLSCWRERKHFMAGLQLQKQPLNSSSLLRVTLSTPSMTAKTVAAIYWQALKLWAKGTPLYNHPLRGK